VNPKCPTCGGETAHLETRSILERLSAEHDLPFFIAMELTHRCNLRCPHCYIPVHDSANELTFDEIGRVLEEASGLGALHLTLTGGEPTLRFDFLQILRTAAALRFVPVLKTNGVFSTGFAQELHAAGLFELQVSLYSAAPERHDSFVGLEGAFQSAVAALRMFKGLGGRVRVSVVLMNWNLEDAVPLQELFAREEWPHTFDFRVEPRLDGNLFPANLRANNDIVRAALSVNVLREAATAHESAKNSGDPVCGIGRSGLLIQPDGNVIPCVATPSISFGNVRASHLRDIWLGAVERSRLKQLDWRGSAKCLSCDLVANCRRCPGTALLEHGDINLPSELDCRMAAIWRRISEGARGDLP